MDLKNKWTIIYTFHDKCLHFNHLQKSNPHAKCLKCDISNNFSASFAWRNNDKLIRNWLKNNIDKIQTNNIAILEWDSLITKQLPDILIDGVCGKFVRPYEYYSHWYWFKDKSKLDYLESYACGLLSFGFLVLNKEAIKIWISTDFDFLYEKDICCELRLGTIFKYSNIKMTEMQFPNIMEGQKKITVDLNKPDYYHPVKYNINNA